MFRRWGLNPVADRAEFVRLFPVLMRYHPRDLAEARANLVWLRKHEPEKLVIHEPGYWRCLDRDALGRWTAR